MEGSKQMKKLDYKQLLDSALIGVVRDALHYAQINGLSDGSHFYITFRTRDTGVVIPDFLRLRYPETMTIVLQHSFTNLNVSDNEFGVTLTFDGRPFYIRVPYDSLLEFKDPSTDFMMQFHPRTQTAGNDLELPLNADKTDDSARVVSLDAFRKKRDA